MHHPANKEQHSHLAGGTRSPCGSAPYDIAPSVHSHLRDIVTGSGSLTEAAERGCQWLWTCWVAQSSWKTSSNSKGSFVTSVLQPWRCVFLSRPNANPIHTDPKDQMCPQYHPNTTCQTYICLQCPVMPTGRCTVTLRIETTGVSPKRAHC